MEEYILQAAAGFARRLSELGEVEATLSELAGLSILIGLKFPVAREAFWKEYAKVPMAAEAKRVWTALVCIFLLWENKDITSAQCC